MLQQSESGRRVHKVLLTSGLLDGCTLDLDSAEEASFLGDSVLSRHLGTVFTDSVCVEHRVEPGVELGKHQLVYQFGAKRGVIHVGGVDICDLFDYQLALGLADRLQRGLLGQVREMMVHTLVECK